MHYLVLALPYVVLIIQLLTLVFLCWWIGMGILNYLRKRPPFVPVSSKVIPDIISALDLQPDSKFYDLGCGDGKVLLAATAAAPEANCIGIEFDWFPFKIAKIKCRKIPNISLLRENFFQTDLASATHIFTYLFPHTMNELLPKLEQELRPGTRLVSCDFKFTEKEPIQIIDLHRDENKLCRFLYIYEF